jgi:hypothetical protein
VSASRRPGIDSAFFAYDKFSRSRRVVLVHLPRGRVERWMTSAKPAIDRQVSQKANGGPLSIQGGQDCERANKFSSQGFFGGFCSRPAPSRLQMSLLSLPLGLFPCPEARIIALSRLAKRGNTRRVAAWRRWSMEIAWEHVVPCRWEGGSAGTFRRGIAPRQARSVLGLTSLCTQYLTPWVAH